jgi:aminopeptidase N
LKTIHTLLAGILVLSTVALAACASSSRSKDYSPRPAPTAPATTGSTGAPPTELTRELAWLRTRQVSQVSYGLWFGIGDEEEHDDFDGRAVVNFELRDLRRSLSAPAAGKPLDPHEPPHDLYKELKNLAQTLALDFEGGIIRSITINGAVIDPKELPGKGGSRYDGHRIYFHISELAASGANRIEIGFSHPFATDGYGFHRFRDPVDKQVYLYTNFEPYGAHRMFPCFDQPDLKASFELTVETPEEWEVIANTMERDVTTVDGRKSWAFPLSPVISPYVFALHAGPYQVWKQDANGIPMRLFARRSLKSYVDAHEWFDATKRGLEFYSTLFAYPYPYSKFDEVIVPDFNAGAMENVAAITFSERFIHRSSPTLDERRDVASVILHEMAHQWFGDLVTMKWWNGLWLNESFATFMATKSLAEATDFQGSWVSFNERKNNSYWEDQLVTTHPIEVPVADTEQAGAIFDGISYGKGASVLKQLMFYLGDDDFAEGLQRYFQKYALRNTTTHEFMKTLGEASGKDLTKWQKTWLQTSGVTGLAADWACAEDDHGRNRVSKFNLVQTPPEGSLELRPHKTQIAFYDAPKSPGKFKLVLRSKDTLTATYSTALTPIPDAIGKPCPDFVYPNHEDFDYAKVELDPVSYAAVTKETGANAFDSALQRQMIWASLWQRVVEGRMRAQDYADDLLSQMNQEKNVDILNDLLIQLTSTDPKHGALLKYLPVAMRKDYQAKIETFVLRYLRAAPAGAPGTEKSDIQRAWFDAFTRIARSPGAVMFARDLLDGKTKLPGLLLRQPERWELVTTLAVAGAPDADTVISAELTLDNTDMGQKSAFSAQAAIPTATSKQEWWTRFLAPIEGSPENSKALLSNAKLRGAIANFYSSIQAGETGLGLSQPFVDSFFAELPKLTKISDNPYTHYFPMLYPSLCEQSIVDRTTVALNTHPDLPAGVVKALRIKRQEEERCIRAQAKATGAVSQ